MEDPKQSQNTVIKQLLRDALTLLCKNTLVFNSELSIEGLLGITVDKNEIILVSIQETFGKERHDYEKQLMEPGEQSHFLPFQARVKGKKRKPNRARNQSNGMSRGGAGYTENTEVFDVSDTDVAEDVHRRHDPNRNQMEAGFDMIEVKQENVGYMPGENVLEEGGSGMTANYSDDCYLLEPRPTVSVAVHSNDAAERHLQNDLDVLEQNVDSFMSVDQKVFQEMFQADFVESSYGVDGSANEGFRPPNSARTSQPTKRPHRRATFPKTEGPSGVHRRAYRFHSRYGYSRILHQCNQCSATFTMSSNLGRHMATTHNVNGDGQCIFCPVCQKKFSRSDNLARHLKQVHKYAPPQEPLLSLPSAAP